MSEPIFDQMAGIRRIEAATAQGWPAAEACTIDGWQVFTGLGRVGRTNSCWPLEYDGDDVEASILKVERHYQSRGLLPQFKAVSGGSVPMDLASKLKARGYQPVSHVAVMVNEKPLAQPTHDVDIATELSAEFAQIVTETSPDAIDGEERIDILRRVPNPSAFGVLRIDGQPAAAGLCAFTGNSAGIAAMRTRTAYRKQGYARSILRAVAARAWSAGSRLLWLQVETNNHAALHLYESEGFRRIYHYEALQRPEL